eukprot:bmy_06639T0
MRPGEGSWDCLLLTVTAILMLPMRPPGSWASRIIGGHKVTPHSRPYMASLNSSAILGPAVGLLGLPRRPPRAGARCKVAGWGSVSDFEELPPVLMEADVRVLGLDVCNSSWRGQLSPAMLCTCSGDRQRRGFCSADSGGPLVCRNRAHGLVSFSGVWCGDPKTPDVYTLVSAFVTWIWDVVRRGPHGPQPSPPPRTTGGPAGVA